MIVLMYHALYADDAELNQMPEEEKNFAVSTEVFRKQLAAIQMESGFVDPQLLLQSYSKNKVSKKKVLLTFDDGHKSFYTHAMPIMKEFSAKGIFFITPKLLETRDDFCSWEQLKEMEVEGHVIGSHGYTHRFFTLMNEQESSDELVVSKKVLDKNLGHEITMISFPGGCFSKREIRLGLEKGYQYFFTSAEGVSSKEDISQNRGIKRFAIRNGMSETMFTRLISGDKFYLEKIRLVNGVKGLLRKVIGDSLYYSLYKAVKG
ncbi:MAG: polysaccharide deacetylase family protein [Gammaproteobacteria bacterium]|nr:polysaccharide deacetylase family protein [Gammaproteobacteria bacterium]